MFSVCLFALIGWTDVLLLCLQVAAAQDRIEDLLGQLGAGLGSSSSQNVLDSELKAAADGARKRSGAALLQMPPMAPASAIPAALDSAEAAGEAAAVGPGLLAAEPAPTQSPGLHADGAAQELLEHMVGPEDGKDGAADGLDDDPTQPSQEEQQGEGVSTEQGAAPSVAAELTAAEEMDLTQPSQELDPVPLHRGEAGGAGRAPGVAAPAAAASAAAVGPDAAALEHAGEAGAASGGPAKAPQATKAAAKARPSKAAVLVRICLAQSSLDPLPIYMRVHGTLGREMGREEYANGLGLDLDL
jgi:hypothetical protein